MIYRTIGNMSAACTLSGTAYTYDDLIALERKNTTLAGYITKCNTLYGVPGNTVSNSNKCTITVSGINMGDVRRYTPATLTKGNFDWEAYVSNYRDLQRAGINTLDKAWSHYTNNGRRENRKVTMMPLTKDNFDWNTYVSNYGDLQRAGINTLDKAWSHYTNHGRRENRKASVTPEEHKTTSALHDEMVRNNKIISSCVPTPSRSVERFADLNTEITAGNTLQRDYNDVKANRAKADALKRELVPEHRYTRETQFEDPLYLETLNAEWNGWTALVFAATAGTILVYAFISSSTK